ncbi:MAG: fibronectin type III domain-containing protein [Clostridia bacterium]|nr:fibronectin type III domain-containing protein [Clostridia bacterium]
MKKLLSVMLAAVMVVSLFSGLQFTSSAALVAQGKIGDNVTYEAYDSGRVIIKGTGDTYHYSETNHSPFWRSGSVTVVEVKSGITGLGSYLFYGCYNLKTLTLGGADTLCFIGGHTFEGCSKLATIYYPAYYDSGNFIKTIATAAFKGCSSLKSFRMCEGLDRIEAETFMDCSSLQSISIPATCTNIKTKAFDGCNALRYRFYGGLYYDWDKITIGSYNSMLTSADYHANCFGDLIGDNCYYYRYPNQDIHIEGRGATWNFYETDPSTPLNDFLADAVIIDEGITAIGTMLFYNCSGVKEVTLPASLTSIDADAFEGCDAIQTVNYYCSQSKLKDLANAHQGNTALTAATFNALHTTEGICGNNLRFSFNESTGKMTLSGTGDMYYYDSVQGKYYTMPWDNYRKQITSLEIKSGVTSIGSYAFIGSPITALNTPSTLTRIGTNAFTNCKKLANITINGTNCVIDEQAFLESGTSSGTITLNGVAVVEDEAFISAQAKTLNLGNVLTIGESAFAYNTSVETVSIPASCSSVGNAFYGCTALTKLEVLKSNCLLGDAYMVPTTTIIRGYNNSTAKQYATQYGRTFELIPCITHSFVTTVTAPTCTAKGYTTYTCSNCKYSYDDNYVNALGHDFSNNAQVCRRGCGTANPNYVQHTHTPGAPAKENVVAATCTKAGSYDEVVRCTVCQAVISSSHKTEAAKGHTPGKEEEIVLMEPDCISQGQYKLVVKCTVCQAVLSEKEEWTPAYGHNYKNVKVVKPTATQVGYTEQKCSRCPVTRYVSYTAPTGKLTLKCTARTKQAQTVSWNNVKTATGYQVQISNKAANKWDTYATLKAGVTSYTFKNLAAGNNYKFRVRFYIKTTEGNKFSPWSTTLNSPTLPSGTSLSKLTAGRKAFTAQWSRNAGVTGYQIQYSTNAKFTSSKKVTVWSNKTLKTTVTKLTAGKYYYVRIRTFKTIGGTHYFSTWSNTAKVKTK